MEWGRGAASRLSFDVRGGTEHSAWTRAARRRRRAEASVKGTSALTGATTRSDSPSGVRCPPVPRARTVDRGRTPSRNSARPAEARPGGGSIAGNSGASCPSARVSSPRREQRRLDRAPRFRRRSRRFGACGGHERRRVILLRRRRHRQRQEQFGLRHHPRQDRPRARPDHHRGDRSLPFAAPEFLKQRQPAHVHRHPDRERVSHRSTAQSPSHRLRSRPHQSEDRRLSHPEEAWLGGDGDGLPREAAQPRPTGGHQGPSQEVLLERQVHRALLQGGPGGSAAQRSQHRRRLRRRPVGRASLLRDGVCRRRHRLRPHRPEEAVQRQRSHRCGPPGGLGPEARPRARLHPPRHQAEEHDDQRLGRGEAGGSRSGPGPQRQGSRRSRKRPRLRHAVLHLARADPRPGRHRPSGRHLRAGRDLLSHGHRASALRREEPLRSDAPPSQERAGSARPHQSSTERRLRPGDREDDGQALQGPLPELRGPDHRSRTRSEGSASPLRREQPRPAQGRQRAEDRCGASRGEGTAPEGGACSPSSRRRAS